jgi:hypothetical protein
MTCFELYVNVFIFIIEKKKKNLNKHRRDLLGNLIERHDFPMHTMDG